MSGTVLPRGFLENTASQGTVRGSLKIQVTPQETATSEHFLPVMAMEP